ncbi:MAG: hypothetical protein RL094_602 [Candidatus Parcubacteria bacterium]|jgi:hypothetical protein
MKSVSQFKTSIKTALLLGSAGIVAPIEVRAATKTTPSSSGSLGSVTSFGDLIVRISEILNRLIPLIISMTVLVFIWGVFKLVMAGDNADSRKEARSTITFGIVALFVMVSVWGLVNILKSSFFGSGLIIPQLK